MPGTSPVRPRASWVKGAIAAAYEQVMDIVDAPGFESALHTMPVLPPRGLPSRLIFIWQGRTSIAAGSIPRCLESAGTDGVAPFKAWCATHGFVLDQARAENVPSMGNVTAPQDVMKQYGADILRLWVMNSDTALDLRIGPEILKQQAELYRRISNTLRWLLGNLDGFTEE
jgi:isoleucyl-tRNA synthetase